MNFSEPGCGATTSTTINTSTPLHFARSLFSSITKTEPTNISTLTTLLTAIHAAAYLLLLPQTNLAEESFKQAETSRIANGPLGDATLHASTLFLLNICRRDVVSDGGDDGAAQRLIEDIYEATGCILQDLIEEQERYMNNMARLLAAMKRKWKDDLEKTGSFVQTVFFHLPFRLPFPNFSIFPPSPSFPLPYSKEKR